MKGKVPGLIIWLFFTWARSEDVSAYQGTLELKNGDTFTGNIVSATDQVVIFSSYWSTESLRIPITRVSQYQQVTEHDKSFQDGIRMYLHSGGYITVRSLSFDKDVFLAETRWGEYLSIPKNIVSSLRYFQSERLLYYGPNSQENETVEIRGERNLTPEIRQWVSKAVTYPETFLMEIHLKTPSQNFDYQIQLFGSPGLRSPGSVTLELNEEFISGASYQQFNQNELTISNWKKPIPENTQSHTLRLFGDFPNKTFTLYLNQQNIHTWKNEPIGLMMGNQPLSIVVRYLSGDEPLELTTIGLFEWKSDSHVRGDSVVETDVDTLIFSNAPPKTGSLLSIEGSENVAVLQTENNETVRIPLNHLFEVHLGGGNRGETLSPTSESILLETRGSLDHLPISTFEIQGEFVVVSPLKENLPFQLKIPLKHLYRLSFPRHSP